MSEESDWLSTHPELKTYRDDGAKLSACFNLSLSDATHRLRQVRKLGPQEGLCSRFTTLEQLVVEGWIRDDRGIRFRGADCLNDHPEIVEALNNIGIESKEAEHFTKFCWMYHHRRTSVIDTSELLGCFSGTYNAEFGLIVSINSIAPYKMPDGSPRVFLPGETLPALHFWSNVVFLAYQEQCVKEQRDPTNLKHIIRTSISKLTSAHKVMSGLLVGKDTPAFIPFNDRRTFAAGTNEANALLGTPTGAGVLWMLLRRPRLTGKIVKSVSIFGRLGFGLETAKERMDLAEHGGLHLYFEIADCSP